MKLQTLQALICIEEVGSLRAAAQLLHLSQPALSAAVQQLEEELKAPCWCAPNEASASHPSARPS